MKHPGSPCRRFDQGALSKQASVGNTGNRSLRLVRQDIIPFLASLSHDPETQAFAKGVKHLAFLTWGWSLSTIIFLSHVVDAIFFSQFCSLEANSAVI